MQMNRKLLMLAGMFVMLLLPLPSRADSDGFYCISKGYFAYNLRAAIRKVFDPGTTLRAPHVLRVVRLNQGIWETGEVGMKDFQVHELRCEGDRLTIGGYDKGWLEYVVDISRPGQFRITNHTEETMQQHPFVPGGGGPDQIIGLVPGEVIGLISSGSQDVYQIVITSSEQFGRAAEIRRLDSRGAVLQRLQFYQDIRLQEY
jgi:hypothetical protein